MIIRTISYVLISLTLLFNSTSHGGQPEMTLQLKNFEADEKNSFKSLIGPDYKNMKELVKIFENILTKPQVLTIDDLYKEGDIFTLRSDVCANDGPFWKLSKKIVRPLIFYKGYGEFVFFGKVKKNNQTRVNYSLSFQYASYGAEEIYSERDEANQSVDELLVASYFASIFSIRPSKNKILLRSDYFDRCDVVFEKTVDLDNDGIENRYDCAPLDAKSWQKVSAYKGKDQEKTQTCSGIALRPNWSYEVTKIQDQSRDNKKSNKDLYSELIDFDKDGFSADIDCNDSNSTVYPGAFDYPNDGIENDCDTMTQTKIII